MDRETSSGSAGAGEGGERERGESSSGGGTPWKDALRDIAPHLDLGWRLAGTGTVPPLAGYGLDLWLGTTPWALLGGCVVGFAGVIGVLVRLQSDFGSQDDSEAGS